MSGGESTAEEIYELGIELVNPGGRPEILEAAAKSWRSLATEVDGMFDVLDRHVERTLRESWNGPASEEFQKHWGELKSAIDGIKPEFEEAAKGLDQAAKSIEEINEEIHDIYVEIGVSIGVSVGLSFITMGFSAAAGAARAAQLVAKAVEAAGRLGRLLKTVAQIFRTMYANKFGKVGLQALGNFAGGTAGGVATSILSGKGPEWKTNLVGGLAGAGVGTAAGKGVEALMTGRTGATFISGAAGGAAGGFTGDYANSVREGKEFNATTAGITAVTGGVAAGGAAESAGLHRAFSPMTEGQKYSVDVGINSSIPISGGVQANDAKDGVEDVDKSSEEIRSSGQKDAERIGNSSTDDIKDVFG